MRYEIRPLVAWTDPETPVRRPSHVFKASWPDTLAMLGEEIEKIGGQGPVALQIDVQEGDIRRDGMLRANARVGHPGVVVSFLSKFGPLRYATDAYEQYYGSGMASWQANIRAIALALQALRAVDRYGVTKRGEQYTGWRALAAPGSRFATATDAEGWMRKADDIEGAELPLGALYRKLARRMHPDVATGSADAWEALDDARQVLTREGWL